MSNKLANMMQTVYILFSDGTKAQFTGKAVAEIGDTRSISGVYFGEPRKLPEDCSFEEIKMGNDEN